MTPHKSVILYHGYSIAHCGYRDVTMSINGKRYTYTVIAQHCDTIDYLARKVSLGKALAFAKKHNIRLEQPA